MLLELQTCNQTAREDPREIQMLLRLRRQNQTVCEDLHGLKMSLEPQRLNQTVREDFCAQKCHPNYDLRIKQSVKTCVLKTSLELQHKN